MQFIDYYSVLDLDHTASTNELKMAYRSLVKKHHPDVNHNLDATAKMQLLNEAYLILSDPQAKALYDVEWKRCFEATARQSQAKQPPTNADYDPETDKTYHFQSDVLNDWVQKARKQAGDITTQAIKDAGGIVKEAGRGIVNGVGQILVYFVIINIIFLLVKSC